MDKVNCCGKAHGTGFTAKRWLLKVSGESATSEIHAGAGASYRVRPHSPPRPIAPRTTHYSCYYGGAIARKRDPLLPHPRDIVGIAGMLPEDDAG